MKQRILLVDDEPEILTSFSGILKTKYDAYFSESAVEALEIVKNNKPFACIISDFRMPKMNGIEFLTEVMKTNSDTVRILMTGHADFQTVVNAVNEGNIFRFLSKPVPIELLIKTINDSLRQYDLINSEKELLDKTLKGTIKLLIDIQSVTNPEASVRISRLRKITKKIAEKKDLSLSWELDIAVMLSNIGHISLTQELLEKIYRNHPLDESEVANLKSSFKFGAGLVKNIPRFENIAQIIEFQSYATKDFYVSESIINSYQFYASQIITIAKDYDHLIANGKTHKEAISRLKRRNYWFEDIIDIIDEEFKTSIDTPTNIKSVLIRDLKPDMILEEDIVDSYGMILYGKGRELTNLIILKLLSMSRTRKIIEPIKVRLVENIT